MTLVCCPLNQIHMHWLPSLRGKVSWGLWIPHWKQTPARPTLPVIHTFPHMIDEYGSVPLKSLPHSCSHQADRFPVYVREQGTFYFVFQKIIQNLTTSYHLHSSTLSNPLASFSWITCTASEQVSLLPTLASLWTILNTTASDSTET